MGLKYDFFDFANSISSTDVLPHSLLFYCYLPFFILQKKKADDPVMNLAFFKSLKIDISGLFHLLQAS
jgi:hypothetical protein